MKVTEPFISQYLHSLGSAGLKPITGTFEITQRCNLKCRMCYVHNCSALKPQTQLSAESIITIAESACKQGMLFCLLTGGEPFIREDFAELYTRLSRLGLMLSVNTNGSLADEKILSLFASNPPSRVNVSIYAADNAGYEKMCGASCFDKVVGSIRELKSAGIDVAANVPLTPDNCGEIEKIKQLTLELGIPMRFSSYIYPFCRDGRCDNAVNRMPPEAAAALEEKYAGNSNEQAERVAKISRQENESGGDECNAVTCRAGKSSFWITHSGEMLPCGMMNEPKSYPLVDGFSVAWNRITELTAKIEKPEECKKCENKKNCAVCPAMCYAETGSFTGKPEYVCRMTDALTK